MSHSSRPRIAELRKAMKSQKLDAFIVPRQDEFQGEYVGAYAERLKWLTGFAGSWGSAIIGRKKASIFVDGRYTLQVRQQVDVKLVTPQHLIDAPPSTWLQQNFDAKQRIGFDPWLVTIGEAKRLREAGANLVAVAKNPIDAIWADQPKRPATEIVAHDIQHAGKTAAEKLKLIAETLKKNGAVACVLSDPASVCWALNIRASDVPYTPFVLAYAIVHAKGKAELFVDAKRLSKEAKVALNKVALIHAAVDLEKRLKAIGKSKAAVQLDPTQSPEVAHLILSKSGAKIILAQDPCTLPKARKNAVELQGARDAQRRDGAALSRFLHWLQTAAPIGKMHEGDAAEKLHQLRRETNQLKDLSFGAISAAGPNAAIPHYHMEKGHERQLNKDDIYLIDSGGQYLDGTTDVTRTVVLGQASPEMKDRFTRVLKGMIALSKLHFPNGTTGAHIDALARASLWQAGLDFDHGTGHGVGSYLSVHEGPARISKASHVMLDSGMILSNEPGYYKSGDYGIRIENLLIVKEPSAIPNGERDMMSFETLTLAPIDRTLIDSHLLTRDELNWLDAYHARVLKELSPLVDHETANWLKTACAALT